MKKYILLALVLPLVVSCKKEVSSPCDQPLKLGSISFTALQSKQAFNGALEIFPCTENTTTYVGNYQNNAVSVINPSCVIAKGAITNWGHELLLPLGTYKMVYWGLTATPVYSASRVTVPALRLNGDLSDQYWSMTLNSDKTTYMPVWDQVMAVQNVQIGASQLSVDLERKVAGLTVTIRNSNYKAFDPAISSFEILVGGIAQKINMITGEPVDQTKTVKFALTIDPTRQSATNVRAMLYPSSASPSITINVTLVNGQSRSYTTTLKNAFQANSVQDITILTADILASDPAGSSFTVDEWSETSQTIDAPII